MASAEMVRRRAGRSIVISWSQRGASARKAVIPRNSITSGRLPGRHTDHPEETFAGRFLVECRRLSSKGWLISAPAPDQIPTNSVTDPKGHKEWLRGLTVALPISF